ncbi:MAG: flagellar FliJ family protein [Phycisphaerales bacterium]
MARGFEFELQAVLEHRERLERARQGEVARIEGERMAIEGRIRGIQQAMSDGRRHLRDALQGGGVGAGEPGAEGRSRPVRIDAARIAANSSLHDVVRLQRAAIELAGVHQRLAGARQRLLAATVSRKAVETLRTRRYTEWKRRMNRLEESELDDLAVMRAGRKAEAAV